MLSAIAAWKISGYSRRRRRDIKANAKDAEDAKVRRVFEGLR
jgi:hypothetical protein